MIMDRDSPNTYQPIRRYATATLLVAGLGVCPLAPAATDWLPVTPRLDDPALDQQRGGFRVGNLEIAIGLEQVVAIDGQIEIINRLLIPNLNRPAVQGPVEQTVERVEVARINTTPAGSSQSTGGGTSAPPASGAAAINGTTPASVIASEIRNGAWLTQIQNDVDQRIIQNIRSLNIRLNNVGLPSYLPENFGDHFLQSPAR